MTTPIQFLRRGAVGFLCLLTVSSFGIYGCSSDRVDGTEGTVLLSITDFDELPISSSVNNAVNVGGGFIQIGEVTLQNVPKDPRGTTSELQSIELTSYEIVYSRADTGTRVPPARVRTIFGLVPVGGNFTLENLDILGPEQLLNEPLSDLLFENGGFDSETGSPLIVLDVRIRFFGRTLSGDEIASGFDTFTLELTP